MKTRLNYLLIMVCLSIGLTTTAQPIGQRGDVSAYSNNGTKLDSKWKPFFDFIAAIASNWAPIATIATLGGVIWQIIERRTDDRLKNQLDRINKQISELYGPLYARYETGHRNYFNYLALFGDDVTFNNPNFGVWLRNIFEPTNHGMESLIINNADLIIGKHIPKCFLQFCKWSALMKVYEQAQLQDNFDNNLWKSFLEEKQNKHPEVEMQAYIYASVVVLKEAQNSLLARSRDYVDEEKLIREIEQLKDEYIGQSKNGTTWENQIKARIDAERATKEEILKTKERIFLSHMNEKEARMKDGLTHTRYLNPVIDEDFPDPLIIEVEGQGYYAYATHDEFSPTINNILVRHSLDLVHWSPAQGALLSHPEWAKNSRRFWCPHVVKVGSMFRMYYATQPDTDGSMCLALAFSDGPTNFVDCGQPIMQKIGSTFEMIDPCFFIDPISQKHLLYYGSAHQPIRVVELDQEDGKTIIADPVDVLYPDNMPFHKLREGAFVTYNAKCKRYFLWISGDNTWAEKSYAVSVFWSDDPIIPFKKIPGNHLILQPNEEWDSPGHNCIVEDALGQEWICYHAVDTKDRYISGTNRFLRKMCMDRIFYTEDGWPYIKRGFPSYREQSGPVIIKEHSKKDVL